MLLFSPSFFQNTRHFFVALNNNNSKQLLEGQEIYFCENDPQKIMKDLPNYNLGHRLISFHQFTSALSLPEKETYAIYCCRRSPNFFYLLFFRKKCWVMNYVLQLLQYLLLCKLYFLHIFSPILLQMPSGQKDSVGSPFHRTTKDKRLVKQVVSPLFQPNHWMPMDLTRHSALRTEKQ